MVSGSFSESVLRICLCAGNGDGVKDLCSSFAACSSLASTTSEVELVSEVCLKSAFQVSEGER